MHNYVLQNARTKMRRDQTAKRPQNHIQNDAQELNSVNCKKIPTLHRL